MATRLYLPNSPESGVNPFPTQAGWGDTSITVQSVMRTAKQGDALTTRSFSDASTAALNVLFAQYVSPPLTAGQTIVGNTVGFLLVIRASETDALNNLFVRARLLVMASDGVTARKTLNVQFLDNTEVAVTTLTSRSHSSSYNTGNYNTVAGDYLYLELGLSGTPSAGGSHSGSLRLGDSAAADLLNNDSGTTDNNPYLDFVNDTLTFSVTQAGQAAIAGTSAVSAVGTNEVPGQAAIAGATTLSALGREIYAAVAALTGQATISALATRTTFAQAALAGTSAIVANGTAELGPGHADIAGTSAVTATGTVTRLAQAAIPGAGTVAANATAVYAGAAALAGAGAVTAAGSFLLTAQAALTGSGAVSAVATNEVPGIASLSGSATVSADGREEFAGKANIVGAATLAPTAHVTISAAAALAGAGTVLATGTNQKLGQAAIFGTSLLAAAGIRVALGQGLIAGGGNIFTATGRITRLGKANIAGQATVTGTPRWIGGGKAFIIGQATVTATVLLVIPFPPQRIRADVYSAAGVRLGDGPLMDVLDAGYSAQLDQIGQWTITVPATSDRVELLAHGNEVWLYREGEGLVFKGIVARVVSKASENGEIALTASGFSIAARLAWKTAGVGRQYINSTPSAVITSLFSGTGWTLTYVPTMPTDPTDVRIDGASRWYGTAKVCERFGIHMRDLSPAAEVEVGPLGDIADQRLQNVDMITPELRFNGKVAAIVNITVTEDSADIVNRLFAYGGDAGDSQLDLSVATLSSPYTVHSVAAPPGGTKANYYIEDAASQTAYGVREEIVTSKDIVALEPTDAGFQRMANMLYIGAVNEMLRRKAPIKSYDVEVASMAHYRGGNFIFYPGDKLSVLYRGIARGIDGTSVYLDINTDLWLMGYTRNFNQDGSDTWKLSVSTIDKVPKNSVVDIIEDHSTDKGRRKTYDVKRVDGPIVGSFNNLNNGTGIFLKFTYDDNDLLLKSAILRIRFQVTAPAPTNFQFDFYLDGSATSFFTISSDWDLDMLDAVTYPPNGLLNGNYQQPLRGDHVIECRQTGAPASGVMVASIALESIVNTAGSP